VIYPLVESILAGKPDVSLEDNVIDVSTPYGSATGVILYDQSQVDEYFKYQGVSLRPKVPPPIAYLEIIEVAESKQGKGRGGEILEAFMREAAKYADRIYLYATPSAGPYGKAELLKATRHLESFYKSHGFKVLDQGGSGAVMWRELPGFPESALSLYKDEDLHTPPLKGMSDETWRWLLEFIWGSGDLDRTKGEFNPTIEKELGKYKPKRPLKLYRALFSYDFEDTQQHWGFPELPQPGKPYLYRDTHVSSWTDSLGVAKRFASEDFGIVIEMMTDPQDIAFDTNLMPQDQIQKGLDELYGLTRPGEREVVVKPGLYPTEIAWVKKGKEKWDKYPEVQAVLAAQAFHVTREVSPMLAKQANKLYQHELHGIQTDPPYAVYTDGKSCGGAVWLYPVEHPRLGTAWEVDVVVDGGFRGQGVATQLIDTIDERPLVGNPITGGGEKLLRSLGFRGDGQEMVLF
jgi:GNAT superfamily N-acetyltransferase